ncbi:hypothetical protein GQX73_g6503 [Xylaria multiplex]|uniref:Uncharacterized protein n=1 Tax=Xylaria multiplex TaxID=323545 RepID=A0A7C8IM29_9PEZI|nr:hypothetical protein GQX73_g6503 [Xylaria multiplex]
MLTPQHRSTQQQRQQQHQQQNSNYLTAPSIQAPPTGRNYQRDSIHGRPTSSVYSQPSPEAAVFAAQQLRNDITRPDPLEISPPSSPDVASPKEGPYPGDVSPIEEAPDTSLPSQEHQAKTAPRSNIPMMRRERRKNADAAMNSIRESKSRDRTTPPRPYGHDVLWDPRTGEPTTSTKGRPSQVNPQEYVHGLTNRVASATSTTHSGSSPPNPASLRDRLRPTRQTTASPQPEPAPRPGWRGASGRTAIVAPVRDNKNVTPLNIPPRNEKKTSRNAPVLSPVESTGSEAASSPLQVAARSKVSPEHDEGGTLISVGATALRQPQSPDILSNPQSSPLSSAYPTPPLSEETIRANRPLVQESATASASQLRRLQISSNDKAIRRKPARVSSGQYPEPSTPSNYSQHDIASFQTSTAHPPSEWTQPSSRFGITASNHTSTPRVSDDESGPPLPTPPQLSTPTPAPKPNPEISILERGRPTVSGYEDSPSLTPTEPVKINLESPFYTNPPSTTTTKSLASVLHPLTRVIPEGNHSTLSVASVLTLEKSLPPAPPEASAKDRVTELNAQLEALGNRRININTAIRKLTEMMPTDNILASDAVVRKREGEKRKVETLRTELADVDRQSYELGLKLHRAYKRLDRNAEYEPTTLWVRRVTG